MGLDAAIQSLNEMHPLIDESLLDVTEL
jgi:hypothetical protein